MVSAIFVFVLGCVPLMEASSLVAMVEEVVGWRSILLFLHQLVIKFPICGRNEEEMLREGTSGKGNDDQPTSAFPHVNGSNVLVLILKLWRSIVYVGEFKFLT